MKKHILHLLSIFIITFTLSSCANRDNTPLATDYQNKDPLEPLNRVVFNINQGFFDVFLDPIVYTYRAATPLGFRIAIRNIFSNFEEPLNAVNSLLQGNISAMRDNIYRFIVNTTYGIGGINDVASDFGLPSNDQDFGKTLAVWGLGSGPYIELPLLGGHNLRDAFGVAGDFLVGPFTWILWEVDNTWLYLSVPSAITIREKYINTVQSIKNDSLDFYSTMRETYRQNRKASINKTLGIENINYQYDFDMDTFE